MLWTLAQKVRSRCVSHARRNQTGLAGRNVHRRSKDCIFVFGGVSLTEWPGWTGPGKSNCIVHSVNTEEDTWELRSDSPGLQWLMDH